MTHRTLHPRRRLVRSRRTSLYLGLLLAAGCFGKSELEVSTERSSPLCEGTAPRTLDEVYAASFAQGQPTGCTVGCHGTGAGGLTFQSARELWEATVGVPAPGTPEQLRIAPGYPERSQLYLRLLPEATERMPQGGPYLDEAALRDVAGWICAGARAPTSDGGVPPVDGGTGNPPPQLVAITPPSVLVGAGEVALSLSGDGFLSTSEVSFDGTPLGATYVSPQQLDVRLSAAVTAESGTHRLRVTNPAPGGGTTPEQVFSVLNPAPTLSSLQPSSVATQGAPFTLTLTGTGFTASSTVVFNDADVPTTFVGPSSLKATIPTLTAAGGYAVLVRNPAPGGGASSALTLTAAASSTPTVTGLEPDSVAEGAAFTLAITGSGYDCSPTRPTVSFNGGTFTPTSCAATRLVVSLPATPAGNYPVQVSNSNGDTSNTLTLRVATANPVPTLTAMSPAQAARGATAFTLQATGTRFVPGAVLLFNGNSRTTTFVSETEVTAAIPSSDLASSGSFPVSVSNPAPGGGASNSLSFSVAEPNPVPSLSSLTPCGTVAGAGAFTLTLSGAGFTPTASVSFSGTPVSATFISASELRASIPAALVASAPAEGAAAVTVTNPAPGGGSSPPAFFGVASRAVTLAADVQPIFSASCASSGCHSSPSTPVNLTTSRSYAELVGVPSSGCSTRLRVKACGPLRSQSFLVDKILATNTSPACSGGPMPKGAPLSATERQIIIDWVAQGAPP